MLDTDEVKSLYEMIKNQGQSYVILGLANKINTLSDEVQRLARDNQDLRNLIDRMRNSTLEDQAYIEVQKIIIDNRDVIKPNDEDIWNIHRRIDKIQQQLAELISLMSYSG